MVGTTEQVAVSTPDEFEKRLEWMEQESAWIRANVQRIDTNVDYVIAQNKVIMRDIARTAEDLTDQRADRSAAR